MARSKTQTPGEKNRGTLCLEGLRYNDIQTASHNSYHTGGTQKWQMVFSSTQFLYSFVMDGLEIPKILIQVSEINESIAVF